MKKIIQPFIQERSEYFCDVCGQPAVSLFRMEFGYGSDYDMDVIKGDFCNKHGVEFRLLLLKKYKNLKVALNFEL